MLGLRLFITNISNSLRKMFIPLGSDKFITSDGKILKTKG